MFKHKLLIAATTTALLFASVSTTFADGYGNCQPVYGGGQNCQSTTVAINKMVQNPLTNTFVDNLGANQANFLPEQQVTFQVTVTNTGNTTINRISVKDIFPDFLSFVKGDGSFDPNTKTLTFTTDGLGANQSRSFTIVGKLATKNSLPSNQGVTCMINQATATTDNGQSAQDASQFCVQLEKTTKGGLPIFPTPNITKTPPTGPEMATLLGLIPAAFAGITLRRKASK